MPGPLNRRATYSLPALQKYILHVHLPEPVGRSIIQDYNLEGWGSSIEAKRKLEVLQKYQQSKIPFANLYFHYSKHHLGTLDQGLVYEYLVNGGGIAREGKRSLGVLAEHMTIARTEREKLWDRREPSGGRGDGGSRVAKANRGVPKGVFDGWNHLINLVEFEGRRHLVDVGFVANGPTAPIPLVDGFELPWGSTNDQKRIIWSSIPEFETPDEKCWILQHRNEGNDEWDDIYCFTENECLPQDLEVMNWIGTHDVRRSFFNHMVLVVRTVLEGDDVVGVITMVDGKVKRRIRGNTETLVECMSEVERWEALEEWFGVVLGEQERWGVRGLRTELKGTLDDH